MSICNDPSILINFLMGNSKKGESSLVKTSPETLNRIPKEVMEKIFDQLSSRDFSKSPLVCKKWNEITTEFWALSYCIFRQIIQEPKEFRFKNPSGDTSSLNVKYMIINIKDGSFNVIQRVGSSKSLTVFRNITTCLLSVYEGRNNSRLGNRPYLERGDFGIHRIYVVGQQGEDTIVRTVGYKVFGLRLLESNKKSLERLQKFFDDYFEDLKKAPKGFWKYLSFMSSEIPQ